jgi:hypothetical protein
VKCEMRLGVDQHFWRCTKGRTAPGYIQSLGRALLPGSIRAAYILNHVSLAWRECWLEFDPKLTWAVRQSEGANLRLPTLEKISDF